MQLLHKILLQDILDNGAWNWAGYSHDLEEWQICSSGAQRWKAQNWAFSGFKRKGNICLSITCWEGKPETVRLNLEAESTKCLDSTAWSCFLSQMSKTTTKKQFCSKLKEKANTASTWIWQSEEITIQRATVWIIANNEQLLQRSSIYFSVAFKSGESKDDDILLRARDK